MFAKGLISFFVSQTFDPKKRITVEEALAHPYLEAYVRFFSSCFGKSLVLSEHVRPFSMIPTTNPSLLLSTLSSLSLIVSTPVLFLTNTNAKPPICRFRAFQCTRTTSAVSNSRNCCTKKSCLSAPHPSPEMGSMLLSPGGPVHMISHTTISDVSLKNACVFIFGRPRRWLFGVLTRSRHCRCFGGVLLARCHFHAGPYSMLTCSFFLFSDR